MMKKIFLLVAFFVLGKMWSYAQYPITQNIGADSTIVISKGALQSRLIPIVIADTNAANAQRIKGYPGAQLYTSAGEFYVRNSSATKWVLVSSGSSGPLNIYNSDGTLTGNRTLSGANYSLTFNQLSKLLFNADSTTINTDQATISNNGVSTLNVKGATGRIFLMDTTAPADEKIYELKSSNGEFYISILNDAQTSNDSAFLITSASRAGINTTSTDSTLKVGGGVNILGGLRVGNLPTSPGTKQLRINAQGQISIADTSIDAGGTVTSVATNDGTGIKGGTITTSGTLYIDTTIISTKANVSGGLAGKLSISDTSSMLNNYFNSAGYGLTRSGQTVLADSSTLSSYYLRRKDSLTTTNPLGYVTKKVLADTAAAIRGADAGGTVTSVATNNGSGITGGTITTSGTLAIDTTNVIATKASVSSGLAGKLNISDTAAMLAPYLRAIDTASLSNRINTKLNISDTATMLGNYLNNVGYGLSKVGQVALADSATLSAYYLRRKDSLTATNPLGYVTKKILSDTAAAIRSADAGGTVTSVATNNGTGITGGTITTSGTLAIDTLLVSTRAWRQKGIDSVQGNLTAGLATKLNISDTASMLSPYLRSNSAAATYVPLTRTITINGTSQDLSVNRTYNVGTVTSVGLTMPAAFSVANTPVISSGTLAVTAAGVSSQYIRGDGQLATLPTTGGGGSSVSYYLNGSINQGTFGGNTYYQMNKTPIIGTGTDFTISSNGYIASFITDAGDPALLNIPAGNWDFEVYFQSSSSSGTPSFYVELYKYDGTTFTLIASSSTNPKFITGGTTVDAYYTPLAVPSTSLTITDRLAIRVYVNNSGNTITLHTEDNNLCQVITTFSTGINALNGLTTQVQYFATGTSGTDFGISSVTNTHTFNLPIASGLNTGKLSNTDWTTFNNKVGGSGTTNYVSKFTGAGTIGNSQIQDDGTLIGVGGSTYANTKVAITGIGATSLTNGLNVLNSGGVSVLQVRDDGVVGINAQGTPDSSLTVRLGTHLKRGVRMSALPQAPGTKALRIDASGTISYADTLIDAGGTVTSVATNNGTGITGGTITTTGTLAIDTLRISTRAWRQKGIDSVAALINSNVSGTTNYVAKFTGTNTIGNSQLFDNGTNVGIGTSSPANILDIYNTNGFQNRIRITGTTNTSQLQFSNTGGDFYLGIDNSTASGFGVGGYSRVLYSSNAYPMVFFTNALERMRLDASGNLGLGTSSPSGLLDIQTASNTYANIFTSNTNSASVLTFVSGATSDGAAIGYNVAMRFGTVTGKNAAGFTERMRLDASGNLGLSVTPSAWGTTGVVSKAVQVNNISLASTDNNGMQLSSNSYWDGSSWRYIASSVSATNYFQSAGVHAWRTAGSGVAGNPISFTQAMTLDASGRLGIGTTSPAVNLAVYTATTPKIHLQNSTSGILDSDGLQLALSGSDGYLWNWENGTLRFATNNSEAARFTSGGNLLVGTTTDGGYKLDVAGTGRYTGALTWGSSGAQYMYAGGTSHRFAYSDANTNYLYSGGASGLRINNQADNATLAIVTDAGNVGIGTTSPDSALTVQTGAWVKRGLRLSGLPSGIGTKELRIDANGVVYANDTLSNDISGSGTTNYIPKFTSSSAIGNSVIYESGGSINIIADGSNTTFTNGGQLAIKRLNNNPYLSFHDNAGARIGYLQMQATGATTFANEVAQPMIFATNGSERMRLTSSGNLLVGGTTDAGFKLDVTGNGRFNIPTAGDVNYIILNDDSWTVGDRKSIAWFSNTTKILSIDGLFEGGSNVGMRFSTYSGGVFNQDVLTISASGNLGLGTSAPSSFSGYTTLSINNATNGAILNLLVNGTETGRFQAYANTLVLAAKGATSNMLFETNGSERMRLDASGNLGINTTNPLVPLHVETSGTSTSAFANVVTTLRSKAAGRDVTLQFSDGTSASYIGSQGSVLYFATNGSTERMRLDANGALLVGITSAYGDEIARFYNSSNAGRYVYVENPNTGISAASFVNVLAGAGADLRLGAYGTNHSTQANNATIFNHKATGSLLFGTVGSERMRLDASGRLGIGTSAPVGFASDDIVLQVNNTASTGSSRSMFRLTNGYSGTTWGNGAFLGIDNNLDFYIYNYENNALLFGTNGSEKARITSGGAVGINTSSPDAGMALTLRESSTLSGALALINRNATKRYDLIIDVNSVDDGAFGIYDRTAGAYRQVITSGGNIGLGISTPLAVTNYIGQSISGTNGSFVSLYTGATQMGRIEVNSSTDFTIKSIANVPVIFGTNNTERMRITSGGNVGIGSTAPSAKLVVSGTGDLSYIYNSGASTTDANFYIYSATRDILMVRNSGNIGIGTASPTSTLSVYSTAATNVLQLIEQGTSGRGSQIQIKNAHNTGYYLGLSGDTNGDVIQYNGGNTNMLFYTNATERMRITSGGNVLVGTTTDAGYKLHVSGDINFTNTLKFAGVNVIHNSSTDVYINGRVVYSNSTLNDGMYINYNSTGGIGGVNAHLRFFANGSTERMRIDASNGNVGINTTSPSARLHVFGTSGATTTLVEGATNASAYGKLELRGRPAGAGQSAGWLVVSSTEGGQAATNVAGIDFTMANASGNAHNMQFSTHNGTSLAERMRISSTGNVLFNNWYGLSGGDMNISTNTSGTANIIFATGAGAGSERMRLTSAGNLGIGATSPSDRLTVGNGSASQFIRTQGTRSDILIGESGTTILFGFPVASVGVVMSNNSSFPFAVGTNTAQPLVLGTNGTEAMRVTSAIGGAPGKVLVNTTIDAGAYPLQINKDVYVQNAGYGYAFSGPFAGQVYKIYGSTLANLIFFNNSFAGNIASIDGATGAYTALSDSTKKKDFEASTLGLNAVLDLKPTLYRMKSESSSAPKHLGFLAQEVKNVVPQAYVESDKMIGLDYSAIIPVLTKAIQELNAKLEALKSEIETLKNK